MLPDPIDLVSDVDNVFVSESFMSLEYTDGERAVLDDSGREEYTDGERAGFEDSGRGEYGGGSAPAPPGL